MNAAKPGFRRWADLAQHAARLTAFVLAVVLLGQLPALSQPPAAPKDAPGEEPVDGLFVSVRNPVDSLMLKRVEAATNRFLDRPDHRGLKVVYDFNPDGFASCTTDYGTCRDLAQYILDLQDINTVAFVHNDVTGHTILPVLACKEIVMAKKAKIGSATRGQTRPLEKDQLEFYKTVAERRRLPVAAILRLVDKNTVVPGLPPDGSDLYDAIQAEKFGLCDLRLETRQEVKEAYRLPTSSLREDPLQGRSPDAWRIVLSGPVTKALKETMERRIPQVIARGANLIIVQLECHGGETEAARDLAEFLRTRKDDRGEHSVMTVAYVTERAKDTATIVALGCTEIVMDRNAHLGGFEDIVQARPKYAKAIADALEELAEKQGYAPLLARAMLDPNISVYRVRSQRGKVAERRLVDGKELEEDQAGEHRWQKEAELKPAGRLLTLDSAMAKDLDVAKYIFDGKPNEAVAWFRDRYGLEQIKDARPDWLDDISNFLRSPAVSVFLVMIGITGLILELKIPGIGLPGVVAALCFVLYFWAHSQLAGHLTWLAVLLFFLGLVLVGLEIFVVPGLGITGVSGVILMVVSLALVTLVKKPETTEEWMSFGTTLTTLGLGLVGSVVAALVLAWYLPHIPYASRLVLIPPSEEGEPFEEEEPAAPATASLLGTIGEAATTLRPAGKARFGDDYVDVVAEGSYVPAGARIQVVEIEGNRVVVKAIG
jgi:membrane-bound ClpP family serine protease